MYSLFSCMPMYAKVRDWSALLVSCMKCPSTMSCHSQARLVNFASRCRSLNVAYTIAPRSSWGPCPRCTGAPAGYSSTATSRWSPSPSLTWKIHPKAVLRIDVLDPFLCGCGLRRQNHQCDNERGHAHDLSL